MKKILLFSLTCIFVACTPFDSNKLNKELIQGRWEQVEIVSFVGRDMLKEEISDVTFLTFSVDSCIEEMKDLKATKYYKYDIKDYFLSLKNENDPETYLGISKLTKDSLLLKAEDRVLKYIRETE